MVWVARFPDGTIQTVASTKQETTNEELADDDPEVVAWEKARAPVQEPA